MRIVLASRSPRRREILGSLGVTFDIISADADESSAITDPALLVKELALRKGRATRALLQERGEWDENTLIIAADTVVALNDRILGKPADRADAVRMLEMLAGNHHRVISGIALLTGGREASDFDTSHVHFGPMTRAQIDGYADSGEPMDKAGAYAIQGLASLFVEKLEGCYFNVVGLPVYRLNRLCEDFLGKNLIEL